MLIWYWTGFVPQSVNLVCPVYCQDGGTQRTVQIPPSSVERPIRSMATHVWRIYAQDDCVGRTNGIGTDTKWPFEEIQHQSRTNRTGPQRHPRSINICAWSYAKPTHQVIRMVRMRLRPPQDVPGGQLQREVASEALVTILKASCKQ